MGGVLVPPMEGEGDDDMAGGEDGGRDTDMWRGRGVDNMAVLFSSMTSNTRTCAASNSALYQREALLNLRRRLS